MKRNGTASIAGALLLVLVLASAGCPRLAHRAVVPEVMGMTQPEAESVLASAGLRIGEMTEIFSDTVPVGMVVSQDPAAGTLTWQAVSLCLSKGPESVPVPNVAGLTQSLAEAEIAGAGLTLGNVATDYSNTVPVGDVIDQHPAAGTSVAPGSPVRLVVSIGPRMVAVPNVVGMSQAGGVGAIAEANLTVGTVTEQFSASTPTGEIMGQTPAAGTSVSPATAVNLVVSKGPEPVAVPDLSGLTGPEAESALASALLALGAVTEVYSDDVAAGVIFEQDPSAGVLVLPASPVNVVQSRGRAPVAVPNVIGSVPDEAESVLAAALLTLGAVSEIYSDTIPAGRVADQDPPVDTLVLRGTPVDLALSLGPAPVVVPNVVELPWFEAGCRLQAALLTLGAITQVYSSDVAAGNVVSHSPAAGIVVERGATVTLVLSLGPEPVYVPNIGGYLWSEAEAILTAAGLTLGTITFEYSDTTPDARIFIQQPAAGSLVYRHTSVNIVVSKGVEPVVVPDLTNMIEADAVTLLESVRLKAGVITRRFSDTVAAGRVLGQGRAAGELATPFRAVDFLVSKGRRPEPLPVDSLETLQKIGKDPAYPIDGSYSLTDDIDASATADWNEGAGFAPIGTADRPFEGMFDGDGHVISHLYIDRPNDKGIGLFGWIGVDGIVANTRMEFGEVTGSDSVGQLAGSSQGTVSGCYAMGVTSGGGRVGGLIGNNLKGTVTDCYAAAAVLGGTYAGGLVGDNQGMAATCGATGSVSGGNAVGGLAGVSEHVAGCFAVCEVSGTSYVGGLIGSGGYTTTSFCVSNVSAEQRVGGLAGSSGLIIDCFSAGSVDGHTFVGGLVGSGAAANATASFWNMDASGWNWSSGGLGLTTDRMMRKFTFSFAGWDFDNTWDIVEGVTYPYLRQKPPMGAPGSVTVVPGANGDVEVDVENYLGAEWPVTVLTAIPDEGYNFAGWSGKGFSTHDHLLRVNPLPMALRSVVEIQPVFLPERIALSTIEELQQIGKSLDYPIDWNYELVQDIDASATATWNEGRGFEPIGGTSDDGFMGTLDGQGHVVSKLFIDREDETGVGLFRTIGENAMILNLGIEGGYVRGWKNVGMLIGDKARGEVNRCYTSGEVIGTEVAGGLIGYLQGSFQFPGEVSGSYSTCRVTGSTVGGLIGRANSGSVTDCYATGAVTGGSNAGGLFGISDHGTATNCYAAGPVTGTGSPVGGLTASASYFAITASFWDTENSGRNNSAGGLGKTTAQMTSRATFAADGWDFENIWTIVEGETYPYFAWQDE